MKMKLFEKEKVKTIEIKAMNGDRQDIVINNKPFTFSIYLSPNDVIEKLSNVFEFSYQDIKDVESMW